MTLMEFNMKRIVDIVMTILLMCLMAYQVTGEVAHEFIGMVMVALVIVHQILNRKWYGALFKSKYNAFRILNTIVDVLLLISFALTAISGMAMSNHAVPFLYNIINVHDARIMHLAFSYWSFMLMGIHLGMHISIMSSRIPQNLRKIFSIVFTIIAGYGFCLLINSAILNYLTFKTHFAFLDYEKNPILVFFENISMLTFFANISHHISLLLKNNSNKNFNKLKIKGTETNY